MASKVGMANASADIEAKDSQGGLIRVIVAELDLWVGAEALLERPTPLEVVQEVRNAPDRWGPVSFTGKQRLARVTFKLAEDSGELRPDEERNAGGRHMTVWLVEGMSGLQQVCEYGGTLARLTRVVPGAVKRCEVVPSGTKPTSPPVCAQCR